MLLRMFGSPLLVISGLILLLIAEKSCCHRVSSQEKGITREYYIAAVLKDWDYAPSGLNKANHLKLTKDSDAAVFVTKGRTAIGKVYGKVLYREYTDNTFTKEKPHPPYLGILGPVIKAEVGDTIRVYFKNKADLSGVKFSVHPHGVFYTKGAEGALYDDGTTEGDKKDDDVAFNGMHTYEWHIPDSHGPTNGDDKCLTWVYHSHVDPVKDINTGLIGPMVICRKGTLHSNMKRTDVDKEFFALFTVFDENVSWLLDKNINRFCTDPAAAKKLKENEDFQEANKMHTINGLFYANLPGLELCLGDKVSWHLFGIGNEVDIHTAYFHGQTFVVDSLRKDVATLLPATFVTATMVANNPGTWMLNCVVDDHYSTGMYALFNVTKCKGKDAESISLSGKTRTYFISAEEDIWDYGPSGMNKFKGGKLNASGSDSAVFFTRGAHRIGGKYKKARYFEYTDSTFTTKKPHPSHLGFLGPVIRAEVGDVIKVVFKNMATRSYSILPHGVFFNKSNEGALYSDFTSGKAKSDDIVRPNQTFVYRWSVPEHTGPTKDDVDCLTWAYYSSLDPVKDTYSGLFGPLLTCRKGTLDDTTMKQKNVKKEYVLMLMVLDESMSWYHDENIKRFCSDPAGVNKDDEDYKESNKMHGINGLLYANLENLTMCRGDKVSWHLIGLGNEVDMHTVTFYGQTVTENKNRKDTVSLLPGTFTTTYMVPDNVGQWAVICKTTDHYIAGMQAKFKVDKCNTPNSPRLKAEGKTRRHYIAAVEREWDYAPSGNDVLEGKALKDSEKAVTFTKKSSNRIGRKYKKALFREFSDDSFKNEKKRTDKYLGVLGPIIYAEVGDTIEVVFKNAASRPYSVHPHGVFFSKGMEGSDYLDNSDSKDKKDNQVSPGSTFTYNWTVPERAGPSSTDTNCLTWAYYSDVDSVKDANSGLVGPLVVCKKNTLSSDNKRKDIDRDFALLFTVMDENQSWYIDENIKTYCTDKSVHKEDEDFLESNKMHVINGYVFGNLDGLEMIKGEKVDWYLMGLGNEVDMHTVHFHGQTFVARSLSSHREDVYDLFPGVFATVEMIPDSIGKWMLHCHVDDHVDAGMETMFTVKEKDTTNIANGMQTANFVILVVLVAMIQLILNV